MKNTMERSSLLIEYVYYIHYNEIFKKILKNKSLQAIERKVKRIIEMTREKFFESVSLYCNFKKNLLLSSVH